MAFRFYHFFRRYDEGRQRWFMCYRFPYDEELQEELMRRIPKGERFWYPETKAWNIGEQWADVAVEVIEDYSHLGSCPGCERGVCRAWSHLGPSQPRPKREQYRETTDQRANAQNRYDEWVKQQQRAQYGQQQQAQAKYQQQQSRYNIDPDGFGSRFTVDDEPDPFSPYTEEVKKETPDPRWQSPDGKPDSIWAMRVLGLTALPSGKELKSLYRKLAMEYHPDLNPELRGDCSKMALINSAKDYLDKLVSW